MNYQHDDGGRAAAGWKGKNDVGDCAVRAVAIASQLPYNDVYEAMRKANAQYSSRRNRVAREIGRRGTTPRNGMFKEVMHELMPTLGFVWVPTMFVGQGCKVHVRADELPAGRLVLALSRHYAAFIDGVLHDTYDCSRDGTRCVYGYYRTAP
jgi:hypothetical protein